MSLLKVSLMSLLIVALLVCGVHGVVTVSLSSNSIGYSSVSGLFYASIPNAAINSPNTLIPINPNTGTLGTAIPIGFDSLARSGYRAMERMCSRLLTVVEASSDTTCRHKLPISSLPLRGGLKSRRC